MSSFDRVVAKAMSSVPECVAVGYVDISTGMLLGVKSVDSHPQEVLDLVAAATSDLYQGDNVITIEKIFKKVRGVADDGQHYFKEFVIFSENLVHFFGRSPKAEDQVSVFVMRKNVNLGMAITKCRMAAKELAAAF